MEIGKVKLDYLGHSGFIVHYLNNGNGKRIAIDPYNVSEGVDKVDMILITHSHYDHCSIKDITKLAKRGTIVITPADAQSKITRVNEVEMQIVEVGDMLEFGPIKIEAMPAYNLEREFHPKKEGWLGYIIKIGDIIIYHAGDSDFVPEMRNLSGYGKQGNSFIVLLPVSGEYTMNADEAAELASVIHPAIAVPMHYGGGVIGTSEDAERFVQKCKEKGVNGVLLEKI